jgi:hypothetical protein
MDYENDGDANAPAEDIVSKALSKVKKYGRQTVREPVRNAFPGVYENPRLLAEEAASRVGPENENMKRLFGVNREELYEMGSGRKGNREPELAFKKNPRGSEAAQKVMTPRNAQRVIDILDEAGKQRKLRVGMDAWYVMDPAYRRLEELVGPEAAKKRYTQLNTVFGMMSPGSEVVTEINRGAAANYLINQGRFSDFEKYGGVSASSRGKDFPADIRRVPGHAYHSTSHAGPLKKYVESGKVDMQSPKVPLYIQSSGVPETGFQTKLPVPDAHFTRALGMGDTRNAKDFGVSMSMPEFQDAGPWFANKVAGKMGMEAVPAQARLWGAASGQTGVTTAIGAPKLELITSHIMEVAKHHGISPEEARDHVLLGTLYKRGGLVKKNQKAALVDKALQLTRKPRK